MGFITPVRHSFLWPFAALREGGNDGGNEKNKQLSVWQYLQEVDEAAPGEIAKNAKVARPTVNQALDKLLRLKKVERIGLGRSTRYRKL